jgi:hypothetical protein
MIVATKAVKVNVSLDEYKKLATADWPKTPPKFQIGDAVVVNHTVFVIMGVSASVGTLHGNLEWRYLVPSHDTFAEDELVLADDSMSLWSRGVLYPELVG